MATDNRWVTSRGSIAENPVDNRWFNLTDAMQVADGADPKHTPFAVFSGACLYFGIELSDALDAKGGPAPPIGLIQNAVGGSTIEAWMSNSSRSECAQEFVDSGKKVALQHIPGGLYYGMVTPFVNMTLAGFVWYQGENNMLATMGNPLENTGYACEVRVSIDYQDVIRM